LKGKLKKNTVQVEAKLKKNNASGTLKGKLKKQWKWYFEGKFKKKYNTS
jgi:hypothetical protein